MLLSLSSHFTTDQNEKARARYGFYMSAGVDAYSRMFCWLSVHNNRCKFTWAAQFLRAVLECGGWQLLSIDAGGENNVIRAIQTELFGDGAVKVCMSRRNTAVERMWKEVNEHPTFAAQEELYDLEQNHGLDVTNPVHLTSLWCVYQPIYQVGIRL